MMVLLLFLPLLSGHQEFDTRTLALFLKKASDRLNKRLMTGLRTPGSLRDVM